MNCNNKIVYVWAALALLILLSGSSSAAENSNGYYIKHEHTVEQDVTVQGYSTIYQDIEARNLQLKNYLHGSGTMDAAILITTNQTKLRYCPQNETTLVYEKSPIYGYESNISFSEQNQMLYSPMTVAYGTGYYSKNPIEYNSKLKEMTCAKSYQEGVSMINKIEYASGFDKDMRVDLKCKDAINYTDPAVYGLGLARMEVEEEVMSGVIHVGQLMTDPKYGWKRPLIEIDEDYIGDIKLTRKMEVSMDKCPQQLGIDWLSCCVGGYGSMEDEDKLWCEEEIFDYTL